MQKTYILTSVDFTTAPLYVKKKEHFTTRPATTDEEAFLAYWQNKLSTIFPEEDGRPLLAGLVSRSEGLAGKGPF